jgi:flagellar hook-associated protein 1 FlgK
VVDPANPDLLRTVRIEFNDPPVSYDIIDDASGTVPVTAAAYVNGQPIEINGHRVAISGNPAGGDLFTIAASGPGPADNRNVLALSKLQDAGVLDGGGTSFHDAFGQTVSSVGATARSAKNAHAAQEALLSQATDARHAVAGVNLDEEAANLMQFQQAYEAAARVIGVADNLFQTLLRAVGG